MRALSALATLCVVALAAKGQAEVRFVDVVVAEVGETVVTASDIALARSLGLFRLEQAPGPLSTADIERYVDGLLLVQEAKRIGLEETDAERAAAWAAVAARAGGEAALTAWLEAADIDLAWARRVVDDDLLRRRVVELRFEALAFVSEADVEAALGPGSHSDAALEATRRRLQTAQAERRLAEWLAEARARTTIRYLTDGQSLLPSPLHELPAAR